MCITSKTCIVCGETKPISKFSAYTKKSTGVKYVKNVCSYCKHRKRDIKKKYGISMEDYDNMLKEQGGSCAICGSTVSYNSRRNKFDIDHCHKTGKVRGLLCNKCNKGIGYFNDDVSLLTRALEYLLK